MAGLPALFDLSGRVAVVTGGGGALGRVAAAALAEAGAAVAVVDLSEAAAATVAAGLGGTDRAIGLGADLSTEAGVEHTFAAVDQAFPAVDILVNSISAPIDRHAPEDFPLATWNAMLAANLTSYFLCSRAAAQRMIPAGRGGSIVNFGSIAGENTLGRGGMAYGVAKGGVAQLTRETAYAW